MCEREITITNKSGLHARPSSLIADRASKFRDTTIELIYNNKSANAKNIMEVMLLGACFNEKIKIKANGKEKKKHLSLY